MEGVSSLLVDIEPTSNPTAFGSLGAEPRLAVTVADQEPLGSLGWGLALLVMLVGLAKTRRSARHKVLYIIGVALVATAVPVLTGHMELAAVTNGMFWAALLLAIYYPVFALLRWAYRKVVVVVWPEAAITAAAVLLAAGLALAGGEAQAADAPGGAVRHPGRAAAGPGQGARRCAPVPYDPSSKVGLPSVDKLLVPYERFVDLWNRAYPEKPIGTQAPPRRTRWPGRRSPPRCKATTSCSSKARSNWTSTPMRTLSCRCR